MNRIITFLFFILLNSSNSIYGQHIKTVIQGHIRGKDTIIEIKKEYSKEVYLLSENEPEIYSSFSYTYDEQGRIKELDQAHGESSSNGYTTFEYYPNNLLL